MARKSIIEIDVQDEKFQRFLKAYKQFEESIGEIPESWKKLDSTLGNSTRRMSALGDSAARSLGLSTKNAHKLERAIQGASKSTSDLGKNAKTGEKAFDRLGKSAHKAASMVGKLVGFAGKVGLIGSGIAGIGGGAALWGLTDLAGDAMRRQRNALGAGVSPGAMAAWGAYLHPVINSPESMLNRIAIARESPQSQWWLSQTAPGWQKESVTEIASKILLNAQAFMKRHGSGPATLAAAGSQGYLEALGGDSTTLLRLQNMSTKRLRQEIRGAQMAAPGMEFSRSTARAWTGLSVQMTSAGIQIKTALINALAPLAPAIRKLSSELVSWIGKTLNSTNIKKWVSELGQAINSLSTWIGSKSFQQDTKSFVKALGTLASETMAIAEKLKWVLPTDPKNVNKKVSDIWAYQQKFLGVYGLGPKQKPNPLMHGTIHRDPISYNHPLADIISQSILNAITGMSSGINVNVSNSTAARVDISSHAASRPQ